MTGISLNTAWARALQAANQALAQREVDLAAAQRSFAEISQALAEKGASIADLKAEFAKAQAEVIALRQALAHRESDLASAQHSLVDASQALADKDAEIAQLQGVFEAAQADVSALRQALGHRESDLAAARHSLAGASQSLTNKNAALNDLNAALTTAQADVGRLNQALEQRENELAALGAQLEQRPTKDELTAASTLAAQLSAELTAAQADVGGLQQFLAGQTTQLQEMSTALEAKTLTVGEQAEVIASLQQEQAAQHEAARQQAQYEKQRLDALETEWRASCAAAQARAEDLVQRLRATEQHRDTLGRSLEHLRLDGSRRNSEASLQIQQLRARAQQYLLATRELRRAMKQQAINEQMRSHSEARLRQDLQHGFEQVAEQFRHTLQATEAALCARDTRMQSQAAVLHDRERALLDRESMLRATQERLATEVESHRTTNADLIGERAQSLQQIDALRIELAGLRAHWTWRWTAGLRTNNPNEDLRSRSTLKNRPSSTRSAPPPASTKSEGANSRKSTDRLLHDFSMDTSIVNDPSKLLDLPGRAFVEAAYLRLLKRSVDPGGLAAHLKLLQRGVSKSQILLLLAESPEGRNCGVEQILGIAPILDAARQDRPGLLRRVVRRLAWALQEPLFRRLDDIECRLEHMQSQLHVDQQLLKQLAARPTPSATADEPAKSAPLSVEDLLHLAAHTG